MTLPTFIDLDDADVNTDAPLKTESVLEQARDNIDHRRLLYFQADDDHAEQTSTSTSWTTLVSVYPSIPRLADYAGIQRLVRGLVIAWLTGGGTAELRLHDELSDTGGTAVAFAATSKPTGATGTGLLQPELNLSEAQCGIRRQVNVQARILTGSGTVHVMTRADVGGSTQPKYPLWEIEF